MAIAMLASTTTAFSQPELHVTEGFVKHYEFKGEPIKTISIGDTTIADALPISDHAFMVQSHKIGVTNMILLGADNQVIDEVIVTVERPVSGLVRIHNKALLNSYTEFACGQVGCQYVGETTVHEPAPLPRGHSESHSTIDSTYHNEGSPQAPAPTIITPLQ
jgi:Flp pilus assembly secretin CpaC